MQKIEGNEKNLKQLLMNTKYTIHYYQRGYMWQRKHVAELIEDLTDEFLTSYKAGDTREAVKSYGIYFMGSIVLAGRDNAIIDGQHRLSSLTLLLMYLNNRLRENGQTYGTIEQMIFSESFGKKSFNLDIEDRQKCMNAIFSDEQSFDLTNESDSAKNLYDRYIDIAELFPSDAITDDMLLHFCDWLGERVFFIEIVAATEQDAYKIFVTMNDRGLSLTPTEMLKGYILSEIKNDARRKELDILWKQTVQDLTRGEPKGDEIFLKVWLRSQYAQTIRERRAGAVNQDYEIIGTSFHNWVRDNKDKLCLSAESDYDKFVLKFAEFSGVYQRIQRAEEVFSYDTRHVFYNARVSFTFQMQLLLATISSGDNQNVITQKINLTAMFVEMYILSRITQGRGLAYDTIKSYVFDLTKSIRGLSVGELKAELSRQYDKLGYDPAAILPDFALNRNNKRYIRHFLARIISFIEEQKGESSHYCEYVDTSGKNPYEVEHIISNHYENFTREYSDPADFSRWRNSIGALLLMRKKINASLSDADYNHKLAKYCSDDGNIYSASLGKEAYKNNPGFKKFIRDNDLPFKAYAQFGKAEIRERINLLVKLFSLIWNSDMFM